jgi:hypothetical protein
VRELSPIPATLCRMEVVIKSARPGHPSEHCTDEISTRAH